MNEQTKIGIAIVHCLTKSNGAGFDIVYKTDDGKWSDLIDDTGEVFRHIKVNNGAIIRMIKFTTDGWYLCSMKQIAGRDEEYRSSWIFFPTNISVSSKEITTIMEEVERNILKKDYNSTALDNIVDRYNNTSSDSPKYAVSTKRGDYAIRFVGGGNFSLFDVFGKIYQKTFTQYAWVILMTREDAEIKDSVEDITSLHLHSSYIIQPPVGEMFGFEPFMGNTVFSKPVRISDNETLSIVWKLNGFRDIPKMGNRPEDFIINESEIFRVIRPSQIKIYDENGHHLRTKASVSFTPGKWNEQNGVWLVPERNIANVAIKVDARGYESYPLEKINLSEKGVYDEIIITLREECHTYRFIICLDKNRNIYTPEFTLSYRERLIVCPFPGYKVQNGSLREDILNTLIIDEKFFRDKYASKQPYGSQGQNYGGGKSIDRHPESKETLWDRWGNIILGCLIGLVVVAICFGVYWFFFKEDSQSTYTYTDNNPYTEQGQTVTEDHTQSTIKDYSAAIQYLEQKTKFKRDEMESTYGLTGLWDMLNTYNFQAINDFVNQNPELKESQRFRGILNIIQKNPQISGKYCRENDFEITISGYINKLNNSLNNQPSNIQNTHNPQPNTNPSVNNRPAGNPSSGSSTKNNSQTSSDNS